MIAWAVVLGAEWDEDNLYVVGRRALAAEDQMDTISEGIPSKLSTLIGHTREMSKATIK